MKNTLYFVSLYLLVATPAVYCPVKESPLEKMRIFLFQTIERPSVADWQSMTQEQKEDWWYLYETNPIVFMTNEQRQEYIAILHHLQDELVMASVGPSYMIATESQRETLVTDVRGRLERCGF